MTAEATFNRKLLNTGENQFQALSWILCEEKHYHCCVLKTVFKHPSARPCAKQKKNCKTRSGHFRRNFTRLGQDSRCKNWHSKHRYLISFKSDSVSQRRFHWKLNKRWSSTFQKAHTTSALRICNPVEKSLTSYGLFTERSLHLVNPFLMLRVFWCVIWLNHCFRYRTQKSVPNPFSIVCVSICRQHLWPRGYFGCQFSLHYLHYRPSEQWKSGYFWSVFWNIVKWSPMTSQDPRIGRPVVVWQKWNIAPIAFGNDSLTA